MSEPKEPVAKSLPCCLPVLTTTTFGAFRREYSPLRRITHLRHVPAPCSKRFQLTRNWNRYKEAGRLLCPAWKKRGATTKVKTNTTILHSRADDVVPFANSLELVRTSGSTGSPPASPCVDFGVSPNCASRLRK